MINHKPNRVSSFVALSCIIGSGALISGCGEAQAPQAAVAPAPAPPPPPPKPRVKSVEQLVAELNIDPRVTLPADQAPATTEERRALLTFFDSIARGNHETLGKMLSVADQLELESMVESGVWEETSSMIESVDVQTGMNSLGDKCALAVIEVGRGPDMTFQPQLWYYKMDSNGPLFEAAPAPQRILDKLSGDWIAEWHRILDDEMAVADRPEIEIQVAQQDLDDTEKRNKKSQKPRQKGPGGFGPLGVQ